MARVDHLHPAALGRSDRGDGRAEILGHGEIAFVQPTARSSGRRLCSIGRAIRSRHRPAAGRRLAVLGGRFVDGQSELWVARTSESGRDIWRKSESGLGFANGWAIAAINGKIYVSGRTSPDGRDDTYRLLMMRFDAGDGAIEWRRWDYPGTPSSGPGLVVAGEGGGARLYAAGWVGKPRRARLTQVGPTGDLVWDSTLPSASGATTGVTDLALAADGSGFGIGLEAPNNETLHPTLARFPELAR